MGRYEEIFARSIRDPQEFWREAAGAISWYKKWERVLDGTKPPFYRWFSGAELNTCYNTLDRHVEGGRANQTALIYDSPVTKQIKHFTYRELRDQTAKFAGVLRDKGVKKGDRVVIYMPMIPEAVVAVLAWAQCIPWSSAASLRTNLPSGSMMPNPTLSLRHRARSK